MIVDGEFDFSQALKRIRLSRGLLQKDVGERMGIDPNRVSNWEKGYNYPTLPVFRDLCLALNCAPEDLLGLSPSELSSEEYNLLKGYRALNGAGKHTMLAALDAQLDVRKNFDG